MVEPAWIDPWQHTGLPWQGTDEETANALPAHVLVDRAFAPTACESLHALSASIQPLFKHRYAGEGLDRLSPCLLTLPDDARARERCWQALLGLSLGAPMLSVLRTTAEPGALIHHLRRIWEAESSVGEPWLLRWADGRAAAVLLEALDGDQRRRVLAGLQDWYLPTRTGGWMRVAGAGGALFAIDASPLMFTAVQGAALRRQSQADAIARFVLQRPSLRPDNMMPSHVHRCAEVVLARLARRGIDHLALAHRMTVRAVTAWDARSAGEDA